MDIFDILKVVSKRKIEFEMTSEKNCLKKAMFVVSKEYNIPLNDVQKICRI